MATGSKFSRMTPFDGERRLSSAMMLTRSRRSAGAKSALPPTVGIEARTSLRETSPCASCNRSRLRSTLCSRMSLITFCRRIDAALFAEKVFLHFGDQPLGQFALPAFAQAAPQDAFVSGLADPHKLAVFDADEPDRT